MATRKKQEAGAAEGLLTTTAQMIGSTLGKIAVKTGIETPPQGTPTTRKKVASKRVASKKAASKKAASKKASSKSTSQAKK